MPYTVKLGHDGNGQYFVNSLEWEIIHIRENHEILREFTDSLTEREPITEERLNGIIHRISEKGRLENIDSSASTKSPYNIDEAIRRKEFLPAGGSVQLDVL